MNRRMMVALIVVLAAASSTRSTGVIPVIPPPSEFVCSVVASYQVDGSGQLKKGNAKIGGTITVNTQKGTVHGDAIYAARWAWRVVNPGDSSNSAKLVAPDKGELAAFTVMLHQPNERGVTTWYPFLFIDGGLGSVVTGTCREVE